MSRLPDFLLIGAAKAGTSSLFELLGRHPGIYLPAVKEPLFFALGGHPPAFQPPAYGAIVRRQAIWRLPEYEALFAAAGARLTGEASTLYLGDRRAPAAVAELIPGARLIAVLRDPVARARSAYAHLRRDGHEPLADFSAALAAEPERMERGYAPLWGYRRGGLYGVQLERWLGHFGRGQLHLIRYEDLIADPEATVGAAWRFLGLDPVPLRGDPPRLNQGGETRSRLLRTQLIGDSPLKRIARLALPARARRWGWRRLMARNTRPAGPATRPGAADDERLRESFAADIARTQSLTGWDLSAWLAPGGDAAGPAGDAAPSPASARPPRS